MSCNVVTNPDARKSILYEQKCCFKCFKSSHAAAECWREIKCFKFRGAHHTSICTFESRSDYVPRNRDSYYNSNRHLYPGNYPQGYQLYPANPNGTYLNPGNPQDPSHNHDSSNKMNNPSFNSGVPSPNVTLVNSSQNSSVLLQTAIAQVKPTDNRNSANLRILFDNGSQ